MGDRGGPDSVGFATLQPNFSDASAQLVEQMRATLRQAQEIIAAVGEAESTVERTRAALIATDSAATEAELLIAESEIERLSATFGNQGVRPAQSASAHLTASSTMNLATISESAPASGPAITSEKSGPLAASAAGMSPLADGVGLALPSDGDGQSVAGQMTKEIETTVMWVQQLLESVHFTESDEALEPGASLLHIVQPRLRQQKDDAVNHSLVLFNEKKETEKDVDEHAAFFRSQALQAVSSQKIRGNPA